MQRSLKATGLVACFVIAACSQIVDFDRSKISSGSDDAGGGNGSLDGGKADSGLADAAIDGNMSMPDGEVDAGSACDPVTHAGCDLNQLCCDGDSDGRFECIATSPGTQCERCGMACNSNTADDCTDRTCGCGWKTKQVCSGDLSLCEPETSECVECIVNSDCQGSVDGEFCFAPGATPGALDYTCVECDPATNAGCDGTKPICNAMAVCVACNVGPKTCESPLVCLPSGACECSDSDDCTTPTAPICDVTSKQCEGCSGNQECVDERGQPYCVDNQRCAVCVPTTEAGCTDAAKPDCRFNASNVYECLACTTDAHCENKGDLDTCEGGTGECVECVVNDDCRESGDDPNTRFCDTTTNTCVACRAGSGDCGPTAPICNGSNVCVACTADAQCDAKTDGTYCVTGGAGAPIGTCAACDPGTDNGCMGPNDQCLTGAVPACVNCDASGGCTGDTTCKTTTNQCVECLGNADCREVGDDPSETLCDTATNTCVGCLQPSDCNTVPTAPICVSHSCSACANDAQCDQKTDGTVCAASGACGLCDPSNSAECTSPSAPICDPASLTCKGCNEGGLAATACDDKPGALPECVTGGAGSTAGSCGACDPADNSGCSPAGLDRCKAGAVPTCVDCLTQADCSGNLACVANTCQACASPADCAGHPSGESCIDVDPGAGTDFQCQP